MNSRHTQSMETYTLAGLGGLSGLHFEKHQGDEFIFWSHSDRGPNGDQIQDGKMLKRPFLEPGFQPFWVQFSINRQTRQVQVLKKILLTLPDGTPLTGLPNKKGDEVPLDISGRELPLNILGIDPESFCFDGEHIWMGEEYGPSLLKFNQRGQLLARYVPEGSYLESSDKIFKRTLPAILLKRKVNRGFEGLTCHAGKVYGILQSPLKDEGTDVRIFEFNPLTERVEQQYLYPLDSKKADKIGDMGAWEDSLFILEQNGETGKKGIHLVYRVELKEVDKHGRLKKDLVQDLVKSGYTDAEKVEGLTIINDHELAVVNDNDFGVNNSSLPSVLAILKLK